MSFMPYIHFDGHCAQAMAFYMQVFGGTDLQLMTYADAPPDSGMPPSDRIMHAQFNAMGGVLMASDFPQGQGEPQKAVSIMVAPPSLDAARQVFEALSEGGTVVMPFGPTFWSPGFGMAQDRFGTHWIIGAAAEA